MEKDFGCCTCVFIGASGSGKGTQIKLLRKYFEENSKNKFRLFASGDILRSDPKIVEYLKNGGLVNDSTIEPFFNNFLLDLSRTDHVIFDGYPRTMSQAEHFNIMVGNCEKRMSPVIVISLEISSECATRRMLEGEGRGIKNRPEDNPEAIKKRLAWFEKETKPIIDWFDEDPDYVVVRINSEEKSIDEIHQEIVRVIKKSY